MITQVEQNPIKIWIILQFQIDNKLPNIAYHLLVFSFFFLIAVSSRGCTVVAFGYQERFKDFVKISKNNAFSNFGKIRL